MTTNKSSFDQAVEALQALNLKDLHISENRGTLIIRFDQPEQPEFKPMDIKAVGTPGKAYKPKTLDNVGGLTVLETELMNLIPTDNFYETGFESVLWTRSFIEDMGLDDKKSRGVLSSLVKKGFINIETDPDEENEYSRSWFSIKQKGQEWLVENCTTANLDLDGFKIN